ncbi:DUF1850 domain-containing protein [bacterium]|nr:DUF1850 domain-containing protein [bacterium]
MAACLMIGARALMLAGASFTLSWTHSVEKTSWAETWELTPQGLHLTEARVQGSGAGMEPGDGARLVGDWWVWQPSLAPQGQILLGASGATVGGWTLCADGTCQVIGDKPGPPIRLAPCAPG